VRILHLSDSSLPDRRVERSAISAVKRGHKCFFAGSTREGIAPDRYVFKETFSISWSPARKLHLPHFWGGLVSKVKEIIDYTNPHLIHAHDVFAGKVCLEIGVPFVYDSHEFWSKDMPLKLVRRGLQVLSVKRIIARSFGLNQWANWQKEIVSETPTLTVSQRAVISLNKISRDVFLLPNFPFKSEVEEIRFQAKEDDFWCTYIGNDLTVPAKHRNIAHLPTVFSDPETGNLAVIGDRRLESTAKIRSLGFLPYNEMLDRLSSYHVGLLTWTPLPYHKYCLPNKVADYAHAGLVTVLTSSLESAVEILGKYCIVIKEPSELPLILKDLCKKKNQLENMSREIVDFARSKLIWDGYEDNIFNAYKIAIEADGMR